MHLHLPEIFSDEEHQNPSKGFLNPAIKERGRMGAPHPGMGEGKGRGVPAGRQAPGAPPLPVRTIDKEWKGRVSFNPSHMD